MKKSYENEGYIHLEQFFVEDELIDLEAIVSRFHEKWLAENDTEYKNGLINSHSLTSGKFISANERLDLFQFIAQDKINQLVNEIFYPEKAKFLNTQLFFDPFNQLQKNYWHRDIQYTGLNLEEQREKIKYQNVVHFRIPLRAEAGIELIPNTHRTWDLEEEFEVRMSLNNRKASDSLPRGKLIALQRTDLLVFSANMIHRGIYGQDRLSFDIIFFDNHDDIAKFIDKRNLPSSTELGKLINGEIFIS